jgi:hypothetical protein
MGVRWTPLRKAKVIDDIVNGEISLDEACRQYDLSTEEFTGWKNTLERHGVHGLRTTRLQCYHPERLRPGSKQSC